ncbi:MAG TPA: hypothetical protein VFP80_12415, partial [Thermoanaerobaculia bacterium]|nr:hypothetical protein [Thermoanaerobaculia bacterium]
FDVTPPELTRVDRDGKVLDAAPRTLPIHPRSGISVAAHGHYVVIGYETGQYEKRALVVDPDGNAVADFSLSGGAGTLTAGPPVIASNGSLLVALWYGGPRWSNTYAYDGVRFDLGGPLGAPRTVFGGNAQGSMLLASDGRGFVVTQGLNVHRMTADLEVSFLFASPFERPQSVVWTGSEYVVVLGFWNGDARDARLVRVGRGGEVLGARTVKLEGEASEISTRAAASAGGALLLAWDDSTNGRQGWPSDTYASMVELPSLAAGPRERLAVSALRQRGPATAVNATHALTVWGDESGFYARRHRRDGVAEGPPLRLSSGSGGSAVVFTGTEFLVASIEERRIVARRLPASGPLRVESETSIAGGSAPRFLALATNGTAALVAWFDNYGYNLQGGTLYFAGLDASGAFADPGRRMLAPSDLSNTVQKVAVSANDTGEFLVVWGGTNPFCQCSPPGGPDPDVLRAARVASSLTVLDQPPIQVVTPSYSWPGNPDYDPEDSLYLDHPSVTWNGNEWLVVWNRSYAVETPDGKGELREEIRGRRIARNGTLLDGTRRDPGIRIAESGFAPTVVWTGTGYQLGWYEGYPNHRDSQYIERYPLLRIRLGSFQEIGGPLANVRTAGEVKWAEPISISAAEDFVSAAYARIADERQYGAVSRVFVELTTAGSRRRTARR